ncbi:ABC transporter permease [Glycomyces buryatensis]|uniref:Transport permease protein n=1 Tax=Glycomyces buryatensis TaxID=2570927 RepID=A0A4S8QHD7_9ACTN|nr:ABC transporter permease [Glycomyces buryatensis]THV43151.1 ABC transporter permease [Glycomyces buryatensis]
MTTLSHTIGDSATMLRRNLKHMLRYPSLTLMLVMIPALMLLMFVYVFGSTLGDGLGGASGGRAAYLSYVTPGILMMAIGGAMTGTAIGVATDMTQGIVDRFRTMSIARVSILTGHVIGSIIQILICVAAVFAIAFAIGYRPDAGPAEWLALLGVLVLISFALTWIAVALGVTAKSVETASNTPMPFTFLPFLSSGFVPTDSMPAGLRYVAEYQPFTPFIEVIRSLLAGTAADGTDLALTVVWSLGLALLGYLVSRAKFNQAV